MVQMDNRKSKSYTDQNELKLINKRVLICYAIITTVICISYVIEVIKSVKELTYVLILIAIMMAPLVIAVLIFRNNPKSRLFKEVVIAGFGVFYAYILFTSESSMTFVYILPLLTVTTMYKNVKYSLRTGIGACLINSVNIAIRTINKGITPGEIANYEIQFMSVALVVVFMIITSKTTNEIFSEKIQQLNREKERQSDVMHHITTITSTVGSKVGEISKEAQQISEQSSKEQIAINQIAGGTAEVASNIQNQLLMSNSINELTEETSHLVDEILRQFKSTKENTSTGSTNMEELMKASGISQNTCSTVSNSMNELSKKIAEVEAILGLIEGVTKQTSMLSLNASIEAARAGEAGRGFAVVAANIQQLSEETKQATEEIKQIFSKLGESSHVAVNAVNELELANDVQTRLITKSKENFEVIEKDIEDITEKVNQQSQHMDKVKASNAEISASIENVSAFTEELTASAEDTRNLTEDTLNGIQRVNNHLENVLNELRELEGLV